MGGSRTLGSGRKLWGPRGLRSGSEPHRVEGEEGGREASGVEENPGRGRQGVGGGVELSPDDSTHHREGRGVESSQDDSTPNKGSGGFES